MQQETRKAIEGLVRLEAYDGRSISDGIRDVTTMVNTMAAKVFDGKGDRFTMGLSKGQVMGLALMASILESDILDEVKTISKLVFAELTDEQQQAIIENMKGNDNAES